MNPIKICRYENDSGQSGIGLLKADAVLPLAKHGVERLSDALENPRALEKLGCASSDFISLRSVRLLAPVEEQEVWAAGVTYLRSKKARMEESDFSASAYDKVYEAPRPEIFFKSVGAKVSGPGGLIGIRQDAKWNVPEPELALVINSRRELIGFTIGNDMSSRDIEGENLLYLPQAKIYKHSCALGPCILLGNEEEARLWAISIAIKRNGETVFSGETKISQIKRRFSDLIEYLFRSQEFPNGVILLTGTGVVPGDDFTLQPQDQVTISIPAIGELTNSVILV